jgi:hypothetical protein
MARTPPSGTGRCRDSSSAGRELKQGRRIGRRRRGRRPWYLSPARGPPRPELSFVAEPGSRPRPDACVRADRAGAGAGAGLRIRSERRRLRLSRARRPRAGPHVRNPASSRPSRPASSTRQQPIARSPPTPQPTTHGGRPFARILDAAAAPFAPSARLARIAFATVIGVPVRTPFPERFDGSTMMRHLFTVPCILALLFGCGSESGARSAEEVPGPHGGDGAEEGAYPLHVLGAAARGAGADHHDG